MRLTKSVRRSIAAATLICVPAMCFGPGVGCRRADKKKLPTHDQIAGPPDLKVSATALKKTVVTPHLEHPIRKGKNVLWCATAQIAWNELCRLVGEPVRLTTEPDMAHQLNKKAVSRADLDPDSYVAMAGFARDGIIRKIQDELSAYS